MAFPMSDILPKIRALAAMELDDLGPDDTTQNDNIIKFMNVVMFKRANQAELVETSDVLNITADGYQDFLKNGQPITDMYEPLALYAVDGTGRERIVQRRTSWEAIYGWFRESPHSRIHTRGISGNHYLKYRRYPKPITSANAIVEFPPAAQWDLIMDVVAMCKLPKNFYEEYAAVKSQATGTATVRAAIRAKGGPAWNPPSAEDREE